MKNMTRSLTIAFAMVGLSQTYVDGAQAPGVAGVEVVVKQSPGKHAVTDSRGTFALDGLPAGSHTLIFRARKSKESKSTTTDKVTVASSYAIKVEGGRRPVSQSSLTSDRLLAGVEVRVELEAGAKLRGQVSAGAVKRMVWVAKEVGSNIPGHWVDADSPEGKAAANANRITHSQADMNEVLNRGNPNMTDPMETRTQLNGR